MNIFLVLVVTSVLFSLGVARGVVCSRNGDLNDTRERFMNQSFDNTYSEEKVQSIWDFAEDTYLVREYRQCTHGTACHRYFGIAFISVLFLLGSVAIMYRHNQRKEQFNSQAIRIRPLCGHSKCIAKRRRSRRYQNSSVMNVMYDPRTHDNSIMEYDEEEEQIATMTLEPIS